MIGKAIFSAHKLKLLQQQERDPLEENFDEPVKLSIQLFQSLRGQGEGKVIW